jgi:hypothetical protein
MNINLSLPEELQVHVDGQLQSGGYGSAPEYFMDLCGRIGDVSWRRSSWWGC